MCQVGKCVNVRGIAVMQPASTDHGISLCALRQSVQFCTQLLLAHGRSFRRRSGDRQWKLHLSQRAASYSSNHHLINLLLPRLGGAVKRTLSKAGRVRFQHEAAAVGDYQHMSTQPLQGDWSRVTPCLATRARRGWTRSAPEVNSEWKSKKLQTHVVISSTGEPKPLANAG